MSKKAKKTEKAARRAGQEAAPSLAGLRAFITDKLKELEREPEAVGERAIAVTKRSAEHDGRFDPHTSLFTAWQHGTQHVNRVVYTRDYVPFSSLIQTRTTETLSKPWYLMAYGAKPEVVKFIEEQFERVSPVKIMRHAMTALETGFSVQEMVLELLDGKLQLMDCVGRPFDWFTFDREWGLRFIPKPDQPEITVEVDEPRVLCYSFDVTDGARCGRSLAAKCYWYSYFSKNILKYALQYLENFGSPTRIGKVPVGYPQDQRKLLQTTLGMMSGQTTAVVDENIIIELLEANVTGSSDMFMATLKAMSNEMAKAIVGGTLVTDGADGGYSSRAAAMAHLYKLRDIAMADAADMMDVMNKVVRYLVALNFGNVKAPYFYIDKHKQEVRASVATVVHAAMAMNVPIGEDDYYSLTGLPQPGKGTKLLKYTPGKAGAIDAKTDPIEKDVGGE